MQRLERVGLPDQVDPMAGSIARSNRKIEINRAVNLLNFFACSPPTYMVPFIDVLVSVLTRKGALELVDSTRNLKRSL